MKTLTILIPVYNEEKTIEKIIKKVLNTKIKNIRKQIIIIDDGSTDNTKNILKKIKNKFKNIKIIFKEKNEGKGSAIREGIKHIKGDFVVIQDADLEYDPDDYKVLLDPILKGFADVVYGTRFLGLHRAFLFLNYVANKILNFFTNLLYNSTLTDMETCYKMFKAEVLKDIELKSNGFEIEPEITAKILKKGYKVYEVPIKYFGRNYEEGKKIKASDGVKALLTLLKYRITN